MADLQKIKNRYKEIIEQSQSENSDEQWSQAYSQMHHNRKKQILAESLAINNKSFSNENHILIVKQRLAQALSNLSIKQKDMKQVKNQNKKLREINLNLQNEIENYKNINKQIEEKKNQYKLLYQNAKDQIQYLQSKLKSIDIDKELMQQQVFFYQSQSQKIKNQLFNYKENIKSSDKIQRLLLQNQILKKDTQRLIQLIQKSGKHQSLINTVKNCHFLGKPYKQLQMWYPEDLISETYQFLKKNKIQIGDKQFLTQLVKFISKVISESKFKNKKKVVNKSMDSYNKQFKLRSKTTDILLKNHGTSITKTKLQSSFACDNVQNMTKHSRELSNQQNNSEVCYDILKHFKNSMIGLMKEKIIKRKKILKLVNWIYDSLVLILKIKKNQVQKISIEKFI